MGNIYESPQASQTRKPFAVKEDVTHRMVAGLEKGQKWAKFIAYMSYFYMAIMVIAALGGVFVTFAGSLGSMMEKAFDVSVSGVALIIVGILLSALLGWLAYYCARIGRVMLDYTRSATELTHSYDFEDLETCFERFSDFNRYTVLTFVIGLGAFMMIMFAVGFFAAMTGNYTG